MRKCRHCGTELDDNGICPKCGSRDIIVTDIIGTYEGQGIKKRNDSIYKSSGKHKQYYEESKMLDFNRDRQKYVIRESVKDRLNDIYLEKITTFDGEVVIDKNEKLSEHQGHGYARKDKENG